MGYIRHHAIIVSGGDWGAKDDAGFPIHRAHGKAKELGCVVSEIVKSTINGYMTFLIAPDGSKEGWEESDRGDVCREAFLAYCETQRYEDRSSPLSWAEVQYGDDNGEARIVHHDDEPGAVDPVDPADASSHDTSTRD